MNLTTLILGTTLLAGGVSQDAPATSVAPAVEPEVTWEAPSVFVQGGAFGVKVQITAGPEGGSIEAWKLTHAAFEVNGEPLGERADGSVALPASASLSLSFDLGSHISATDSFQLGFAGSEAKMDVGLYKAVERGAIQFMDIEEAELAKYKVLFVTNRGPVLVELWPDVAPNHVRNFLDLSNTGFYEGILFHRVSPSFMIQGGCPNTRDKPNDPRMWGSGGGPRRIPAEFNDRKHVQGVLSAARSSDPNSASCQFFVMTRANAGLDGSYSAFGKVLSGMDTVMRIANAPASVRLDASTGRPDEPQRIEQTYVLLP
ncbi:MAG: peptidylprolyl isomerase [Planctomycetota bacterium]